ncbi:uncharacterized protein PV09_09091 [Verruconis gallopava]|uniref:Alpha-L-rhamnosidase C-terminal domain-containing protein n=1 Tax=Verruconis gallopava TaxID=253628 RepID=A0A0D1ZXP2_9PEZI|nr:uncharacterized protein PV09_09091 [Verruconis gallopava]KIV99227.1 hypothetical protein PV09_09091 [Verruconis gallopava]
MAKMTTTNTDFFDSTLDTVILPKSIAFQGHRAQSFVPGAIELSNDAIGEAQSCASVVLDYGRCEGGMPFFEINRAQGHQTLVVKVVYSETAQGIDTETGDGPFFFFSNTMDTYRTIQLDIAPSEKSFTILPFYAQYSQRYQKITLVSPNASVTFGNIGFKRTRPSAIPKAHLTTSDEELNRIWEDGVRTAEMCSLVLGETKPAWEITSEGARIRGQHWAPCRWGTRWTDKTITFQTRIERCGASWGVHMVTNGLIFCLDLTSRTLRAVEGLADQATVFPCTERGQWPLPETIDLTGWISVRVQTVDQSALIWLNDVQVSTIDNLSIRPVLGGKINSGSIAFGGPSGWIAMFRGLLVKAADGHVLYENDLSLADKERTYADFQVGSNPVPCTIDGAKRDRACFGGDLFVTGRSIAYGGLNHDAVAGTIRLLTSHQTTDGYLGNLCSAQAPVHETNVDPPSYAFYSLSYALLLVVAIKDYWLHTGDAVLIDKVYPAMLKLQEFVQRHLNQEGLVEVSPELSMTWFPLGGPIFGVSAVVNLAYYDSLRAMSILASGTDEKKRLTLLAENLRDRMVEHLWNKSTGIFRMGTTLPEDGVCQDVVAYATSLGIIPGHPNLQAHLGAQDTQLPLAFRGLGHWSDSKVVSPYATGYAVEALFSQKLGDSALNLLKRVWGSMADRTKPNFSGCHWEAMRLDGEPYSHDTSLAHAWSTWPVFLLPRYLAGLRSTGPGWESIEITPLRTKIRHISYDIDTCKGKIAIVIDWVQESGIERGSTVGTVRLTLPAGAKATLTVPDGCTRDCAETIVGPVLDLMIQIKN